MPPFKTRQFSYKPGFQIPQYGNPKQQKLQAQQYLLQQQLEEQKKLEELQRLQEYLTRRNGTGVVPSRVRRQDEKAFVSSFGSKPADVLRQLPYQKALKKTKKG